MKNVTITRRWKKFLAVSCSHGGYADPIATSAVLDFRARWKPDLMAHLGDWTDMTALRAGAKGGPDETEPIAPDIERGLEFLEQLECNLVFCGNHEQRAFRLAHHYNAVVQLAARTIICEMQKTCDKLHAELVPWDVFGGWRPVGNFLLGHGTMFNENCPRDHAEAFGNCIFGHWHRTGQAKGRRLDNPTGYCVGTLTRIGNMDYASNRRSTLAWSQGMAFGYYTDNQTVVWLHEQPKGLDEWKLPV